MSPSGFKFCLVSRELAGVTGGGGIGTYAAEAARAWRDAGAEVHILTDPAPNPGTNLAERAARAMPGVHVHAIDLEAGWARVDAFSAWHQRRAYAVYEALLALHERHDFDAIEFPDYGGEGYFCVRAKQALARFDGCVFISRLHTPTVFVRELNREMSVPPEIEHLCHMEREQVLGSDLILSPCQSLLEEVERRWSLPTARARAVVPYPFDVQTLGGALAPGSDDDASITHEPGAESLVDPESRELLYIGRLERRKGVDLLIEAAADVLADYPRAKLRLIGGDTLTGPFERSMRAHLERRLRAIEPSVADRIMLEDALPREALMRAIDRAWCVVIPSRWENFPNVCLEAMSAGTLVVGSSAGGMGELIEPGVSGLLCAGGDKADLVRALREALACSPADRARLGEGARARVASVCDPKAVIVRTREAIDSARPHAACRLAASMRSDSGPTVSVVIPFYNLASTLPETLDALAKQTFREFEIVLIDDGSDDRAAVALVDELAATPTIGGIPLRVVRHANAGLSSARNAGFAHARAPWVVPVDADDLPMPSALDRLVEAKRRNPDAGWVTCLVRYFTDEPCFTDEPGHTLGGWCPLGDDRWIGSVRNCFGTPFALLDRDDVLDVGGYDPWLTSYEDWDLYARLASRGLRAVVIPEFLFAYRVRADSMLRTEAMPKHELLRADLAHRHAGLSPDPSWSARLVYAECARLRGEASWWRSEADRSRTEADALRAHASPEAKAAAARAVIDENIRYRVVDRLNDALKAVGVHRAIKHAVRSITGDR